VSELKLRPPKKCPLLIRSGKRLAGTADFKVGLRPLVIGNGV